MGSVVAVLMMIFHQGRYCRTGSNLVALCFDGITDDIYAYDSILKMALTILTLSSGFIGGEVAPLFSIGSCLGYVLGPVFGFDPMFGASWIRFRVLQWIKYFTCSYPGRRGKFRI